MLFTTILLVFAAASPVFSAPVPSTVLARRPGLAGVAVVPRYDTFSNVGPHHRSKRLVSRRRHAESVQRNAPERRQSPDDGASDTSPEDEATQSPDNGASDTSPEDEATQSPNDNTSDTSPEDGATQSPDDNGGVSPGEPGGQGGGFDR